MLFCYGEALWRKSLLRPDLWTEWVRVTTLPKMTAVRQNTVYLSGYARNTVFRTATNEGEGVVAELNINPLFFKNAQTLIAAEERDLKSGYSMPHDDSQNLVYTVTHEYGHMVFTPLLYDNDWKAEIQDIYKQRIINYSTGDEILKSKKSKRKSSKKDRKQYYQNSKRKR